MINRIFKSILTVALIVFFASFLLIAGFLYNHFTYIQKNQLHNETMFIARAVTNLGVTYLKDLAPEEYRITWIDSDGTILFDSRSGAESMRNHLDRDEVQQALALGRGESMRYSATLMERSIYCALKLSDGTVLRLSSAQKSIFTLILEMFFPISMIFTIAVVLSLILADQLSRKIVKPLNGLNLDDPLANSDYTELTPLLRRIASQQEQLRYQAQALDCRKAEFEMVTGSMTEGLVLLNGKGLILSINPAASCLLGIDSGCNGKDFLSMAKNPQLQEPVRCALFGKHAENTVFISGNHYQVNANPVRTDAMVSGVVLLILDLTEKEKLEIQRREFTANVSHELKTPLHSISGYAELLKNGMVQSRDVQSFGGKIYAEAHRLIRLVEDILHLSRLDDGGASMKWENVDLYVLAQEVVSSCEEQARAADIQLTTEGRHAQVYGIAPLILGMISNLCSNAIKYNHPGGSVTVRVVPEKEFSVLTVSDTGIGIPEEHQSRIFERFYRVDRSHSKAMGGTGLGLSIVKNSAKIHHAEINLHSIPGNGTTVTVIFPRMPDRPATDLTHPGNI